MAAKSKEIWEWRWARAGHVLICHDERYECVTFDGNFNGICDGRFDISAMNLSLSMVACPTWSWTPCKLAL
jgi:hypothetical protein